MMMAHAPHNLNECSIYILFLQIISLENQLRKEGFLEKQHEIQDFWEFITADGNLEKVLEEGKV